MATVTGTEFSDSLSGSLDSDTINALAGNDFIYVSQGRDTIDGGTGVDTLAILRSRTQDFATQTAAQSYTVTDGRLFDATGAIDTRFSGIETLRIDTRNSGNFNDRIDLSGFVLTSAPATDVTTASIYLGNGSNTVIGTRYSDYLLAGSGITTVDGGAGFDYVYLPTITSGAVVATLVDGAIQLNLGGAFYGSFRNIEQLWIGSTSETRAIGQNIDASQLPATGVQLGLINTPGDDTLIGSAGADSFISIYRSVGNDLITGGGGADLFDYSSAAQALAGDTITDLDFDDVIDLSYNNPQYASFVVLVDKFIGNAAFTGRAGEYRYQTGSGRTLIQYDNDGDGVANGTLTISNGEFIIGQMLDRAGEQNALRATGRVGDIVGTVAADSLLGTSGADVLRGLEGADTLIGGAGDDVLDGGAGPDRLVGGTGQDTYMIDDAGDVVVEATGEGADVAVVSAANYSLAPGSSVETLSAVAGTAAINIAGNELSQLITGNNGDNIINGGGGSDTLVGLGGNDTFLVRGPGDVVIEGNGGGRDTVFTTVSYNLGVNEIEVLSTVVNAATDPINLIGNFTTQLVIGNYGSNILNGGSGGLDTLIGLRGDDLYAVGDSRTVIVENAGEGADTVVASVEYTLAAGVSVEVLAAQNRGGTEALTLRGNELAQTVVGNDGANIIDGGAGSDVLVGGGGADRFAFTTALGNGNVDAIVDFAAGTDRIQLSSAIFGAVGTSVAAAGFVTGTAATTADQHIVYNATTGQIFYDADGSGAGAAILFATVAAGTQLSAASFEVAAPVVIG